jgi:hypothetical protein
MKMTNQPIGALNAKQTERMITFTILVTFCSSVFAVATWGLGTQSLPSVVAPVIMIVPGVAGAIAWITARCYLPKLNEKWSQPAE